MNVASLGGALQDAQQKAFFAPFTAASHIPVHLAGWDGLLATLQNRARSGVPGADRDLVLMENSSVRIACQQGLFLPVDPGWLANPPPGDAISRCGIGALRTDLVLAWDKSRVDTAPGWADFWDVARRPGKRGLRRDPRGTLEIALLADGVAPDDVYRTLGTTDGLDRAFRKLDQLRPYIVWWDTPAEAVQIIESGAVLMTSAPNGEVASANQVGHRDFGIQWQQSVSMMLSWAIPGRPIPTGRDAVDPAAADREARIRQLLGFMNDPARQADFVQRYEAVSLVSGVPPVGQALPDDSPATPEHLHDALAEDDGFWLTHFDQIKARFDIWIDH
ncbi:extracellular solute-binding protein [Lichenicola sp.]|uniref:extracellular solute-binding protein n=1 Tax=Lichenicola sp. TaxID=2804529 RepID=UPI003B0075E5